MSKLTLSVALGDYDRVRPLLDGRVHIDGVSPVYMTLSAEETFFRAFRNGEFDIAEMSLSSYLVRTSRGDCDYTAIPVFLSRAFRHTSIYVRKDRISSPADLKGKKIGLPEYQLTAMVWARSILEHDYGVKPTDVTWVRGGIEEPGRPEKIKLQLPEGVIIEDAPETETISDLLDRGEIDGFMAPRAPTCAGRNPNVGWLFEDPTAVAKDYYRRTGIFPIMHVVGIRKSLLAQHPWLAVAVMKAFEQAKGVCLAHLSETSATKITLPFVEEQLQAARDLMGHDFWSYGVDANRNTIEAFLGYHHEQGLSARRLDVSEIFAPSTYETVKI